MVDLDEPWTGADRFEYAVRNERAKAILDRIAADLVALAQLGIRGHCEFFPPHGTDSPALLPIVRIDWSAEPLPGVRDLLTIRVSVPK